MIALYMRLSVADGDIRNDEKEESNSIENQRAALHDFVEHRKDLIGEVVEYIDDGYTGTNFDRPEFKKMLEDMKTGKIDVLITKDLSRLGRNFIEVGDYMEQIFPLLGVRYIAINSNYDSNNFIGNTIGLEMSVMNLVNNLYCKDLSKKVRSGVETKWKSGKSTSGRPPFGYLRDPEDKGCWIIDPAAADTVRRIFEMAAAGDGYQYILSTLNGEHVLTPGQYREKHGHVKRVNRKVSDDEWFWTYENIWKILKTYEYTGALVQKKNSRIKVGSNTSRRVPDDERIVVEGHHEPIVDKDTYYKARSLIREHKRGGVVGNDDFPLREVLYCGNCGLRMYKPRSLEPYVICRHKNVVGKHSACNDSRYPLDKINMIVRRSLRDQLIRMEQLRDRMTETRNNMPDYKKELGKLKMQMQGLESDKTRLYELYAAGSLDKDTYIARRSDVKERLDELNQTIREITTPDESQRELLEEADHYLRLAEKLFSISEITDEMVNAFIERINLYDEEHIEIIFKFEDLLKRIVNAAASESESGKAGVSA